MYRQKMSDWVVSKGIKVGSVHREQSQEEVESAYSVEPKSVTSRLAVWQKKEEAEKKVRTPPQRRRNIGHRLTEEELRKPKVNPWFQEQSQSPVVENSNWDGTASYQELDQFDENYARPPPGSKTEARGKQAGQHVSGEVVELCQVIYDYGTPLPDGTHGILFGKLFNIYTRISNKVVGILMRARRHGLVFFEGEMLYQRRDEDRLIQLLKIPQALEEYVATQEAGKGGAHGNPDDMDF